MEYQKFIPEGWNNEKRKLSKGELEKAYQEEKVLQGYVTKCDSKYNLYVDCLDGTVGIIPREEVEAINIDESGLPKPNLCINKVNKLIQFTVKDINSQEQYILSRRNVSQEALKWAIYELEPGMIVNGIVRSIQSYGVFVEIGGGIVGLLHIEDISVVRIKNPTERFEIGQKIKVMIKSIDRKLERVILTYKELLGSWEDNARLFHEGDIVTGIVREADKSKSGIFIELKPNLVGMAEYREDIIYGQDVIVNIKRIIPDKKKIKLVIL